MTELSDATGRQAAVSHLDQLGKALAAYGFSYQVVNSKGTAAYARVANGTVRELRDNISCFPASNTDLWFWWSWGDRIAPATEVSEAVKKIRYVLASRRLT